MIKLIIADDHQLIREGLKKLFSHEIDIEIVAETNDPFKVPELILKNKFDILLLDINFPHKSGIDLLIELKLLLPKIKVLILSMNPEERYALRTIKAGAMGYISKDSDPLEIIKAIRKINDGRKYITPEFSELLIDSLETDSSKSPLEYLSNREFQILVMIAEGKGQTQIGEILSLSTSTVNTYRSRILKKLDLNSNAELIHYALENNLIN